jgi:hypothetical protein
MRERSVPSFMSENEVACPRCGNVERANVSQENLKACSFCAMLASNHVESHPGEYGVENEKKEARKFGKTLDRKICENKNCLKTFQPTSNRQRFCPACTKVGRNDRDRKKYRERGSETVV